MPEKSRIEQRDELMTAFGMLVAPIKRALDEGAIAENHVPYVESRLNNDFSEFGEQLRAFAKYRGLEFRREWGNVYACAGEFLRYPRELGNLPRSGDTLDEMRRRFDAQCENTRGAIRQIPCDDPDPTFHAYSPFQAYLRLRAMFAGAGTRIDLVDTYLSPDTFYRYLSAVSPAATLTVITCEKAFRDKAKWSAVVSVSELLSLERKDKYRFLVSPSEHDRHCRVDDKIFHLGGSLKDAGRNDSYTITEQTPPNHGMIDSKITAADEWYGPNVTTHRKS